MVLAGHCGLIVLVVFSSHWWLLVFVCVCWWLLVVVGDSWVKLLSVPMCFFLNVCVKNVT